MRASNEAPPLDLLRAAFPIFSDIAQVPMEDTVLIVEDEADMVDLLRYNLSKAGFGVLLARDGLKGLEIARKNRPTSSSSICCFRIWMDTPSAKR